MLECPTSVMTTLYTSSLKLDILPALLLLYHLIQSLCQVHELHPDKAAVAPSGFAASILSSTTNSQLKHAVTLHIQHIEDQYVLVPQGPEHDPDPLHLQTGHAGGE